jgi:hypothetical protein
MIADRVFINAKVITLNDAQPEADFIAIGKGRILAVGNAKDAEKWIGVDTEVVDLQDKTVIPGLNDSHLHLYVYGQSLTWVILNGATSIEEVKRRVTEKAKTTPLGQVIMGRGWDQTLFSENRFLNRDDLDEAAPNHPVILSRVCGHVTAVNSLALDMGEVRAKTPNPPGGGIQKDPVTGEPTGLLMETAKLLVTQKVPQPSFEDRKTMIRNAMGKAVACGLTSVTTDDIRQNLITKITDCLKIYHALWDEGTPVLRINLLVYQDALDEVLEMGFKTGSGDEKVRIGALKIVQDGSLGARTGMMHEPYVNDGENRGLPVHSQDELNDLVRKGHEAGMQIGIHVIGDAASDLCLNAFEKAQQNYPRMDPRHRLIHYSVVNESILSRTKALGVGVDAQPRFVSLNGRRVEEFLGDKRAAMTYAWKTIQEWGIPLAGGSDSPVDRLEPLLGIHNAVNRQVDSVPGMVFQPQECLSVLDAIRMYTLGSAYSTFEETIKGSIEVGKLADLTILDRDPREIPDQIKDIRVMMTVVDGNIVYSCAV